MTETTPVTRFGSIRSQASSPAIRMMDLIPEADEEETRANRRDPEDGEKELGE